MTTPLTEKEISQLKGLGGGLEGFAGTTDPGELASLRKEIANVAPSSAGTSFDFESFQKKLESAKSTALKIQEGLKSLKEQQTTDISGVVADSSKVINDENNIKNDIKNLSTSTEPQAAAKEASSNILKLLDEENKRLEQQRKTEVEDIERRAGEAKVATEKAQEREKGTFRVTLARIGGFLGPSASAVGALTNLATEHRSELAALEGKKNAAIQAANSAINDKQFDIARLKADEIKSFEQEIEDRRNTFFDQSLKVIKERRQQQENAQQAMEKFRDDARTSLNNIITNFGGVDIDALDDATREQLLELADVAEMPIGLLTTPTLKEKGQEATQRQREISNAVALANLQLRQDSLNLSLTKFAESEKLSPLDAQRLGLPRSLVGMSENQIEEQLKSDEIPGWFVELQESKTTETLTKEAIIAKWDAFRNEILKSNPINYYGGIGLPPPSDVTE